VLFHFCSSSSEVSASGNTVPPPSSVSSSTYSTVMNRPSVLRQNSQCQLVIGVNFREECHWSHACKSFKRTCVGSNGILECRFLPKNAHRTQATPTLQPLAVRQCLHSGPHPLQYCGMMYGANRQRRKCPRGEPFEHTCAWAALSHLRESQKHAARKLLYNTEHPAFCVATLSMQHGPRCPASLSPAVW
jgi:hypothetical protein